MTRLSLKSLAISGGVLWGACILCVGLIHSADPSYGVKFLEMTSSIYPGFHLTGAIERVAIRTIEGFIDGAASGLVLAWLYNYFMPLHREA
jgi:hypothetical protein